MSFTTQDDPVLILATPQWLFFGIHGATSPTYNGGNWHRRYSSTTDYPAWRGEYLRCAWGNTGWLLPDYWSRPPTPLHVNAKGLPWLRSTFTKGLVVCGGDPLSKVATTFAKSGGELYVPITRMGTKTWARLDRVRAACLKAGHVVDDIEVEAAAARRGRPKAPTR